MSTTTSNLSLTLPSGSDYVNIETINANFTTLDALGVDYITEQGSKTVGTNSWTYRKWKSKKYECWTSATVDLKKGDDNTQTVISGNFPETFSSVPVLVTSGYQEGYAPAYMVYSYASTTSLDVRMGNLNGSKSLHASAYAFGTVG